MTIGSGNRASKPGMPAARARYALVQTLRPAVFTVVQGVLIKPGQRDVLIDLFDRHFIEAQESVGMTIIGQFRDQERPAPNTFARLPVREASVSWCG